MTTIRIHKDLNARRAEKFITGFRRLCVFYHVKIHMAVCAPCSHISSHFKRFPVDYLKNT